MSLLLITWCSGTFALCVASEKCSFNDNPEHIPMLLVSTLCIGCTNLFDDIEMVQVIDVRVFSISKPEQLHFTIIDIMPSVRHLYVQKVIDYL